MDELEHLNRLYHDWKDAIEAAHNAQHDVILFMQHHLHGHQDTPPLSMQAAADNLWNIATEKQAALRAYFSARLR